MLKEKNTAIILAAGQGTRMGTKLPKQFLSIKDKPVLAYSIQAFNDCPDIAEIILVIGKEWQEYCTKEVLSKCQITKPIIMTEGGANRYDSVYAGLCACTSCDYVFIHDGARPFVDADILKRSMDAVRQYEAVVVGMPTKDTIKIADENGFVLDTPKRDSLWSIQTPQVFSYSLIRNAHEEMYRRKIENVTDDAMVLEAVTDHAIKLVEGSYTNIKITTVEDLKIAENFL